MTTKELIQKHKLQGRWVGGALTPSKGRLAIYEYMPVETPELLNDLYELGIDFPKVDGRSYNCRDRCDNPAHPDFGKEILIFTLWLEE